MKLWGQPAKGRGKDGSVASAAETVTKRNLEVLSGLDRRFTEETTQHTKDLLGIRGWCLWKCNVLDGEVIAVVRDELVKVPKDYPVYTEVELEELCRGNLSQATLRLVHEAKKLAGAKVISGVTRGRG